MKLRDVRFQVRYQHLLTSNFPTNIEIFWKKWQNLGWPCYRHISKFCHFWGVQQIFLWWPVVYSILMTTKNQYIYQKNNTAQFDSYLNYIPIFPAYLALADLRGGGEVARDSRPTWSHFFHFHAVLWGKFGQIIGWRPQLGSWRSPSGKSWISHCLGMALIFTDFFLAIWYRSTSWNIRGIPRYLTMLSSRNTSELSSESC